MTEERPDYTPTPDAPVPARPVSITPVAAKPVPGKSGVSSVAVIALLLSAGALGASGFLWWQNEQLMASQQAREADLQDRLFNVTHQLDQARAQLGQYANEQKTLQAQVDDLSAQRDLLQQKMEGVDQRITKVMQGTARIDWMLAEVVQLVTVAERRLSHLGDVTGGLALLESAEKVVAAMEEPLARALRQALINDIQNLRSAQGQVIDTEGLLLRINSTKQQVQALQPPRPSFRSEPIVLDQSAPALQNGFELFWYKVKTFVGSLVRFQKNKEPLMSVAVDPQARFYLQQSILLLLDQAQLAVLRGEPTTYTLSLQETIDRVQRYLRVDTQEGERVLRELKELSQQSVKQKVPNISESLLALDAFRQTWDKGRGSRDAAADRLIEAAGKKSNDASDSAAGSLP